MKKVLTMLAAVLLAAGTAVAGGSGYAIELDLQPLRDSDNTFVAEARVTELATGEVVAAPRIIFLGGEEGKVQSGSREGLLVEISIGVDEAGETASYLAELREGGELVHAQRLTVRLGGATEP